jgi:hypothetical protein
LQGKEGIRLGKKRREMTIGIIMVLFLVVLFCIPLIQHRYHNIEKAVLSLNKNNMKIAKINEVKDNKAIVFFEWGYGSRQQFGYVSLEKNIFGWKIINRETSQLPPNRKMGWDQSFFPFNDKRAQLIYGKIVDPNISKVVLIQNPNSYVAHIVNYNDGERFWYLMPNKTLKGYLVKGLSKDGTTLVEY